MNKKIYLLIIIAVALLLVLAGYWFLNRQGLGMKTGEEAALAPQYKPLTAEEKAKLLENLTAIQESTLSAKEKKEILEDLTALSRTSELSQSEREKILEFLTAPKR